MKFFRETMKMKIFMVLVFCAYFAAAFPREFNRTISSQLIGKSLPINSELEERKTKMILSTIEIVYEKNETICLGVLVSRERVAFPEACWPQNGKIWTFIRYKTKNGLDIKKYKLVNTIKEEDRLFIAEGVTEAILEKPIETKYWPKEEVRFTSFAKVLQDCAKVFAIERDVITEELIVKPYQISGHGKSWAIVAEFEGGGIMKFTDGEPLFLDNKIVGLFLYTNLSVTLGIPLYIRPLFKEIENSSASTSASAS